jgi:hypothetical protein
MAAEHPTKTAINPILILLLPALRSVVLLLGQSFTALILWIKGVEQPFLSAGAWWTVFGTFADLCCITMIACLLKREKRTLRHFIGPWKGWRDLLQGFGIYLILAPIYFASYFLASRLAYGAWNPDLPNGILHMRILPAWAVIHTLALWWLIWAPTEEATYQLALLPRLEARFGAVTAIAWIGFWWSLQHAFLPLIPDWRYILWRFFAFAFGVVAGILIFRRCGRIGPMITAHLLLDLGVAASTLAYGAS